MIDAVRYVVIHISDNNSVAVFKLYWLFLCIYQHAYSKQVVAVSSASTFIKEVPSTSLSQDTGCS